MGFDCGIFFFFLTCEFGHGKFFGHVILVLEIFWTCDFGCGNLFGHLVLVMGNDELNFCVAEPQESRQPPNLEKCIGDIVS